MAGLTVENVLERGVVYADKWPDEIRNALNVKDPLVDVVLNALRSRKSVIITGNAGDGKSHLAQQALALLERPHLDSGDLLSGTIDETSIVFVRDASTLDDLSILDIARTVRDANATLLITINEGPLATLSSHPEDAGFFSAARALLHRRAAGELVFEEDSTRVLNLAGRQLTESSFAADVLDLAIQYVTPCTTCGRKNKTCPRVLSAKMLKKSLIARQRVAELLRLLTSAGSHLTARDIWAFFIELLYGWTCTPGAELELKGFFWMRLFQLEGTDLQARLSQEFDPVRSPYARIDVAAWLGDFSRIGLPDEYPGNIPALAYRESELIGLDSFASAKRAHFLFSKQVDIRESASRTSLAPAYRQLLETAIGDPRSALRQIVRMINQYRMATSTETELWVSRHHGMAAHRRPAALAASARLPIGELEVRVPYLWDRTQMPSAGYFPDRLLLKWQARQPTFSVDYETWQQLQGRRSLTVDRDQELLDYALDLFMAQAPVTADEDPEIRIRDHREGKNYLVRARHEERGLEVLS